MKETKEEEREGCSWSTVTFDPSLWSGMFMYKAQAHEGDHLILYCCTDFVASSWFTPGTTLLSSNPPILWSSFSEHMKKMSFGMRGGKEGEVRYWIVWICIGWLQWSWLLFTRLSWSLLVSETLSTIFVAPSSSGGTTQMSLALMNSKSILRMWMRGKRQKWRQDVQVIVTELCELSGMPSSRD